VAARRARIAHVRAAARHHVADSQRRRRELSQALVALRQGLLQFRSRLRNTLREKSHAVITSKAIRS
jgi:hypothetical protein